MCFIVVFLKFNLFKKKKTSNCDNNASIYFVEVVIQIFYRVCAMQNWIHSVQCKGC